MSRVFFGCFGFATFLLGVWTAMHWAFWQMGDSDCSAGYWDCRAYMLDDFALSLGGPWLIWLACAVRIAHQWKRI